MTSTTHRLLSAILCLLCASNAGAWGNLGHRVTGRIAEPLLTEPARKQVHALLNGESLATAAVFMDAQRAALEQRWPASERWHYDNRPVCPAPNSGYCDDQQCATAQIARFREILADRRAPPAERALALRLLIHMLGDLHQPVHMADNGDRGGNDTYVRLHAGGERLRLHQALDTELLKPLIGRRRDDEYASALAERYRAELKRWRQGTVAAWAEETHALAVKEVYGRLPDFACHARMSRTLTLSAEFSERAQSYLPEQLTKAGVRIAAVLNDTLR